MVEIFVFVVGAAIGSFLNVVVYRIPLELSVLWPPSRCPKCYHQLGLGENIPILGWLILGGKCRHCQTPISIRYPLVEFTTAIVFLIVYHHFNLTIETIGYCLFAAWLLSLSLIDIDTMTLPGILTKSGLVVGLLFQLIMGYFSPVPISSMINHFMFGIFGAIVGIFSFDLVRLVGSILAKREAMGSGDALLAAMIGTWVGWKSILLTGFLASFFGSFIGGGLLLFGIMKRQSPMPFGPFIALGGFISLLASDKIIQTYMNWFFPTF